MTPSLRKFALTAHITFSVGWIGAIAAYLALVVAAMIRQDEQTLRFVWSAMELIGWSAIVPLSVAALMTGVVQSLGTSWGLFRHYWVVISLVLATLAAVILWQHMPTVSYFAAASEMDNSDISRLQSELGGELLHAGVGLLVLLVVEVLNVYKPRGVTPYGWRKQQEQRMPSPP